MTEGPRCAGPLSHSVASEGFEPPKSKTADLQSDPFGRLGNSPGAPVRLSQTTEGAISNITLDRRRPEIECAQPVSRADPVEINALDGRREAQQRPLEP